MANQVNFCLFLTCLPFIMLIIGSVDGQYEDVRCKCICPVPSVVSNATKGTTRKLYIRNVAPNQCNCDFVVLPQLSSDVQSKAKEFCPRCECKYESRDTSIIRFFVIFIIGVISFLVIYMLFLMILDPWIHKRQSRNSYKYFNEEVSLEEHEQQPSDGSQQQQQPQQQEHQQPPQRDSDSQSARHRISSSSGITDDVNITAAGPIGVLNRVGHSQNKWKRQVKEQRRNIFDNHTILN
ncbi:proton-transporting V-type ATPase complex assembly regulator TMEM9 [Dermatophagoides farinae]|uniref:Transmembrane protein 9-like protein n=1 Tax=Dermatophagoides farinae TaxID=6954 RepID=A0A9D4SFQ6_DERFA|nr:proton-transporting V-type ATPase complex assembly regulator TMEM9-like [Dermatophagoides farinae]KAH7640569.1 transmembrane protein 9-like protein [Dermatophagoides farinae]